MSIIKSNSHIKVLGFYIAPNRKRPNKGVVWSCQCCSPCLCAGLGGGGNIVPTILYINHKVQ